MWVSEKVFVDTGDYFDRVCLAIDKAQHSVVLEMYIFQNDELGHRILDCLERAFGRGVGVRLVVDGVGSPDFNEDFIHSLGQRGIGARVFHPAPTIGGLLNCWSLSRLHSFLSNINKRNHRKLIVVDETVAFVGSCNVSDAHRDWRETAVCITGQGVADLCRSFELIWSRSSSPGLPGFEQLKARLQRRAEFDFRRLVSRARSGNPALVRMNCTASLRVLNNAALARQIARAVGRVWITNAYFVPSPVILAALLRATHRGCDVRLLLPGKTDVSVVSYVSRMFYRRLINTGAKIYEYQPSVLHAKTLLIDDWSCVGTTNLNHRSFYHDLEVDVALSSEGSKAVLARQFEQDLAVSRRIAEDQLWCRSPLERLAGYLIYPFRRFI